MMDPVVISISRGVIALLSLILYVFAIASFFPRIIMRPRFSPKKKIRERGLRKMLFDGGKSIVYEPDMSIRKHIKQYTLIDKGGAKFIKCKINEDISLIRYELAVFDLKNRLIDLVCVAETISENGFTRTVALPPETAYVVPSLKCLRYGDVEYTSREKIAGYKPLSLVAYIVLTALTTVIETLALKNTLDYIFRVLEIGDIARPVAVGWFVIASAFVGTVYAAIVALHYTHKMNKVKK